MVLPVVRPEKMLSPVNSKMTSNTRLPKKNENPVWITPLNLAEYFLLKTVYRLKVSAAPTASKIETTFVPEEKSAKTSTPAMHKIMAKAFFTVIFSFKNTVANKMVNTELEQKMMAIKAGESAFKTATCSISMLIQMHKTPKRASVIKSFAESLMLFLRSFVTAKGSSIAPPIKNRINVMARGETSAAMSLLTGSKVVNKTAVSNM